MKNLTGLSLLTVILSGSLHAAKYEIKVTNLTKGQGWGLPLLVAHSSSIKLFQAGMPASEELRALAEDGDNMPLATKLEADMKVYGVTKGNAPLLPGMTETFTVESKVSGAKLTVIGMLGTTNDTFASVHNIPLQTNWMSYYGAAYDAGTEVNNESCAFIPGPPCGNPGVPQPDGSEGYVYVSNGINGIGDLDPSLLNWMNPVIKIEVKKK